MADASDMPGAASQWGSFLERHPHPVRSIWRRVYVALNPVVFATVHVNEYPKSGGTWLCRMLRDCLGFRFDDNRFPVPGQAVVKHHRIDLRAGPAVTLIRDPRDVLVSYFHHCRAQFEGDAFNRGSVALASRLIFEGCRDEREMKRRFVETCEMRPVSPSYTWAEFYTRAEARGDRIFRYEDLRSDPVASLTAVVEALGLRPAPARIEAVAEEHDIGRILAGRDREDRHHFIRRGKVGGYVDELERDSIALIEERNAALMRRYGYL